MRLRGPMFPKLAQYRLEQWQHHRDLAQSDDEVPHRFEFFPTGGVGDVAQLARQGFFCRCSSQYGGPAIEIFVRAPVAAFQLLRSQPRGLKHRVPSIVGVPIVMENTTLFLHTLAKQGSRIRREDM